MKKIALIAAALMATGIAHAQSNVSPFYTELGYVFLKVDDKVAGAKASPAAARGFVGYDFHKNFGVELMVAGGTTEGGFDGDTGRVKLKNSYGVFIKPKLELNEQFEVFGRLGWLKSKIWVADADGVSKQRDSDLAWGVGATYKITPHWSASMDYTSYYDKNSVRVDGVGLSVGYRF